LDLSGRLAVVVGGGQVAGRKAASLRQAGARVRLVAPRLGPEAAGLAAGPGVEHLARGFEPADLEGAWLVISATDDERLNRRVADEAERRRVFCNVVDVPPLCSFIVPAVVNRGELMLAVSTGGASPAAARRLRQRLQAEFGPEWAVYLRLMRRLRRAVTARGRPAEENRPLFYALADAGLPGLIADGDWEGVDRRVREILGRGLAELGLSPAGLEEGP
jgi:precorrin-2 dehydrogenase/sirohydrochlorin ferrochelatase